MKSAQSPILPFKQNSVPEEHLNRMDENDPNLISQSEHEMADANDTKEDNPSKRSGRKGMRTSWVWTHFVYIAGQPESAKCKYCSSKYLCSSKSHGITNLKNHFEKCAKSLFRKVPKGQKTLAFKKMKREDGLDLRAVTFNQDDAKRELAKMVICDEMPFKIVDNEGFRNFVHTIQPLFKIPSRMTIARECMKLFLEEREKIKKHLKNEVVCITTDTWTSIQNINYMCITAHWIDCYWNLNKRIINFVQVQSHKGDAIGLAIELLLLDWGIEKLFTVTVDNASSNDVAIRHLQLVTKDWKGTFMDHKYIHMRCCAHILNLIVKDGLDEHDESILRICNVVRYVRSSPSRLSTFRKCVDKVKIDCKQSLCLDVETRWISTYLMLEVALKYEKAFKRLEVDDRRYCKYFDNSEFGDGSSLSKVRRNKNIGPPSEQDWKKVYALVKFLKLFHQMTLRFSTSLNVSSNSFFIEIVSLHSRLLELCKSDDNDMKLMAQRMKSKFDKYWDNLSNMNYLVYVAAVLDPRYKLKYLKYCFEEIYDQFKRELMVEKVKDTLSKLYDHFNDGTNDNVDSFDQIQNSNKLMRVEENDDDCVKIFASRVAMRMRADETLVNMTEMGRYLDETCENFNENFDVLAWWRVNGSKYPILSRIARAVLVVPMSTIASESTFSTSGRVICPYRSLLSPKTVEVLVCSQNWFKAKPISIDIIAQKKEVEELEVLEHEIGLLDLNFDCD